MGEGAEAAKRLQLTLGRSQRSKHEEPATASARGSYTLHIQNQ